MSNAEAGLAKLQEKVGQPEGTGEWFTVTQDLINMFADATKDHQWIHVDPERAAKRSEEHTSELQSPLIISYAVFCLKKKKKKKIKKKKKKR